MQYNVENSDYAVEFTAVNMDVAVTGQAEIEAVIGNAAQIDVGEAINYIKSGQAEIEQAVATGTAAFNLNATQKTDAFNANATSKITAFDNNTSAKTDAFNLNASNKTTAFNQNATDKTTAFNSNASDKTTAFNNNASSKTTDFNDNATAKTGDFNSNASDKTSDFNDNYTVKKGLIDAEVANAAASATAADNSAKEAKQWAIGDPTEPTGNSAKYWADEAAATVGNCANVDLSNLSATGEAKFDAKQDVISDLTTIRSGAALGATALQPNDNISELNNNVGYITGITSSDVTTALGYTPYNSSNPSGYITSSALTPYALSASLATVATSGSYNDLLNKPTIPTVNDATLTITQGGVSKGTFTANASSNVTIALDSGGGSSLTAGVGIDITNDVISVDGVKDQRNTSTAIKTWTGTKAQYDAIVSKDANTLYNITDDTDVTLTLLEALYPVGSIYIGTMATCPLATLGVGTWVLKASDRVLQGSGMNTVGDLVEAGLPNITGIIGQGDCAAGTYNIYRDGAFYAVNQTTRTYMYDRLTNVDNTYGDTAFDASRSSSIYGNSSTVQPPAYIVNIWERIA